jgi:hypothetical protein
MSETYDAWGSMVETPAADAFALLARWNLSLTAFYLHRWQRQLEFPGKLLRSTSPDEILETRRTFAADLLADYNEQAESLRQQTRTMPGPGEETTAGDYGARLLKAQQDARTLLDQAKAQAERIIAAARTRAEEIVMAAEAPRDTARRSASG